MTDSARARLRLNLGGNEIEIEGSDEFIQAEVGRLASLARLLSGAAAAPEAEGDEEFPADAEEYSATRVRLPEAFRDWIAKMPEKKTERMKLLWAGYYVQLHSRDRTFRIRDVNKLLEAQELTINHPSQVVHAAVKSGEVLRLTRGRYRVSNLIAQTIQAHFLA
ncbi:MAG: hypothetical protein IRZ18_03670 [Clostridia bacterium]|nr:hypothetical protein [Clostridia bacterium]